MRQAHSAEVQRSNHPGGGNHPGTERTCKLPTGRAEPESNRTPLPSEADALTSRPPDHPGSNVGNKINDQTKAELNQSDKNGLANNHLDFETL